MRGLSVREGGGGVQLVGECGTSVPPHMISLLTSWHPANWLCIQSFPDSLGAARGAGGGEGRGVMIFQRAFAFLLVPY